MRHFALFLILAMAVVTLAAAQTLTRTTGAVKVSDCTALTAVSGLMCIDKETGELYIAQDTDADSTVEWENHDLPRCDLADTDRDGTAGPNPPSGSCDTAQACQITGNLWLCNAGTWAQFTSGGDSVSIDGTAVTDPDFVSTGDVDFVDTSNTVTGNIGNDKLTGPEFAHTLALDVDLLTVDTNGDGTTDLWRIGDVDGDGTLSFQLDVEPTIEDNLSARFDTDGDGTADAFIGSFEILPGDWIASYFTGITIDQDSVEIFGHGEASRVDFRGGCGGYDYGNTDINGDGTGDGLDNGDDTKQVRNMFAFNGVNNLTIRDLWIDGGALSYQFNHLAFGDANSCRTDDTDGDGFGDTTSTGDDCPCDPADQTAPCGVSCSADTQTSACASSARTWCPVDHHIIIAGTTANSTNITIKNIRVENLDSHFYEDSSARQTNLTFDNIYIKNGGHNCIRVIDGTSKFTVSNSYFEDASSEVGCILADNSGGDNDSTEHNIINNTFIDCHGECVDYGSGSGDAGGFYRVNVSGNVFRDTSAERDAVPLVDFDWNGTTTEVNQDLSIVNNTIQVTQNRQQNMLRVKGDTTTENWRNVVVSGNTMDFSADDSSSITESAMDVSSVTGGVFANNAIRVTAGGTEASFLNRGEFCATIGNSEFVSFIGNKCELTSGSTGGSGGYLFKNVQDASVFGNTLTNSDSSNNSVYAIAGNNGASRIIVAGNAISGFSTGVYFQSSGANSVENVVQANTCHDVRICVWMNDAGTDNFVVRDNFAYNTTSGALDTFYADDAGTDGVWINNSALQGGNRGGLNANAEADHGSHWILDDDHDSTIDTTSFHKYNDNSGPNTSFLVLRPTDSPPTCAAATDGGIYYDASLNFLCDCNGTQWEAIDDADAASDTPSAGSCG